MKEEVLRAANESGVWVIALIVVAVVVVQSLLYIRLAFKTARKIGYPADKCRKGLRSGAITAVGPSVAIFIIMVGMMSVVGAPITWLRLSVIGAAPTELTAATVGAQAYGVEFGSADYNLMALATSWWTMAINGIGYLLVAGLFAHRFEKIRERAGARDPKWIAVLTGSAMLGCFAFLNTRSVAAGNGELLAGIGGGVSMIVLMKTAQRLPWLKEYALGIAMLCGMAVAALLYP